MIDTTKTTTLTPPEVELAARTFASNIGDLENRIDSLSLKSLKRVLKAIVKFPLQDGAIVAHKEELDIFERCMELMAAKSVMVDHVLREQEVKGQENQGETNGK